GGRMLGRHLVELGHRDIALISGPAALVSTEERLGGLKESLDAAGARLIVHHAPRTRDEGYRAAGPLLAQHPELTAVTGTADQMAIGALAYLRDHGRSVPGDISVAGFNDIAVSRDLTPSLTTVRLPLREMGSAALDIALGSSAAAPEFVERQLGVELVVRWSPGPAREG